MQVVSLFFALIPESVTVFGTSGKGDRNIPFQSFLKKEKNVGKMKKSGKEIFVGNLKWVLIFLQNKFKKLDFIRKKWRF